MNRRNKTEHLCRELEEVAGRLFAEVRREQGQFSTGSCVLKNKRVLVINIHQPIDERVAAIAREIALIGAGKHFLKPMVRAEVDRFAPGDSDNRDL